MFGALRTTLGRWWHRRFHRRSVLATAFDRHADQVRSIKGGTNATSPTAPSRPIRFPKLPDQDERNGTDHPARTTSPEVAENQPVAAEPGGSDAPERHDTEQSLIEVLGVAELPVASARPAMIDPQVRERTLAALNTLRQIPALQSLAQGFLRAMNRPEVSVTEVVTSIEKDSALCVRVLRMANSVLISPEHRIEDLETAVQMLGVARVRQAAQALFTLRDANRVAEGFDWRHLWIHALATAAIAEELERQFRSSADSQVHLAGLLHDVGKIVLSTIAPDAYRDVLIVAWNENGRLEELERERLGVDHREAGVMFAQHNGLPAAVVETIAHHDRPEAAETHRFEVALVAIANYLSKAHGLGFSGSRLDDRDGEFGELSAWAIVAETCGFRPNTDAVEEELSGFIAALRADLKALREEV